MFTLVTDKVDFCDISEQRQVIGVPSTVLGIHLRLKHKRLPVSKKTLSKEVLYVVRNLLENSCVKKNKSHLSSEEKKMNDLWSTVPG